MSITPTDKPPDGDEPPREAGPRKRRSVRSRLANCLRRVAARVRTFLFDPPSTSDDRSNDEVSSSPPVVAASPPAEAAPDVDGFPDRDRPLTYPARDGVDVNTPDVVSVETDEGLRLSVPENPDATIVSDVWTTVDP